ncbi:ADYC domain-containing protein [Corallococcus sp. AB038B]|uniref:ADYC domain-containing protein n=1 Tax=Corallococcus sp. AB038B TaxID=2316718 RepID=UPI0018F6446C|nr:ADYC domain-containing protein [Corallococcus sp. AB038B]
MRTLQRVFAACLAVVAVGCGTESSEPEAPSLRTQVAEVVSPNGRNLNGRNLNGRNLNNDELGGMLVSVAYSGATSTSGKALTNVRLQGSAFVGLDGPNPVTGMGFNGARFVGKLGDGSTLPVRVDGISQGSGVDSDLWSYQVSYQGSDGSWRSVCQDANGGSLSAIAVAGRWNYLQGVAGGGEKIEDATAFTFACEGAAIAKCMHFGYKPWATVNGQSLAGHHQACTRMVRADFCGDGASHTTDGQWVNLYDGVGVQTDTESWSTEAEWNEAGARCFTSETRAHAPVTCSGFNPIPDCGSTSHFQSGTRLISESPYGVSGL